MALKPIKRIETKDGKKLDATGLRYITLTDKGNVQITTPNALDSTDGKDKNLNVEPSKSIKVKPGSGAQIELLADHTGDLSEVLIKALVAVDELGADLSKEKAIRLRINSSELELNAKDTDNPNSYDVRFKTGVKSTAVGEHYCQTKFKGRSFDIRCYEHGGVALQPCGHDSDNHENKIKFESSRKTALGVASPEYADEGGKGLEFGTFNNEHTSLFTGDYRFKADAPIYAVTRGAIAETTSASGDTKWDYPTQSDDTKDIIPLDQQGASAVTWLDIINAVKYLKAQGHI